MGRIKGRKSVNQDRERIAAQVMFDCLPPSTGPTLVVDDRGPLYSMLSKTRDVSVWSRFERTGISASAWPEEGPWSQVVIRLPKGRAPLEMAVHAACGHLSEDGACFVYGGNDEGIRSTAKKLEAWFDDVRTIQTQRKCRVVMARGARADVFETSLADWMSASTLTICDEAFDWVSWPGLFARGGLDDATSLLVSCLSDALKESAPATVLDYGCGTGVLARMLAHHNISTIHALDVDALAIEATSRNVPEARCWLASRLSSLPDDVTLDWVVSNPPFHDGKDEDFSVMHALIEDSAARAKVLWMVTQRQIPCGPLLEDVFRDVERVRATPQFTVWRAQHPNK